MRMGGSCGLRGIARGGNVLEVVHEDVSVSDETEAVQPVRFQGQYHDSETNLHYNRFRYYDPDIGRFVSIDPIGLAGGANTYRYAAAPTDWIDPFGLSPCKTQGISQDASSIVPGGGLQAHENAGGHLLLKHVGQTEQSLMLRMVNEPRITGSSSYYDRATAEYAMSQALDANEPAIAAWLQGSAGRLKIEHSHPFPVGISVSRGASRAVDVSSTRAILVRDASMPTGYKILTGFPTTP